MSSGTATTKGAMEHARNQAGAQAETQQTIPAGAAKDLPSGVAPDQVVWDETLPAGGYAARVLKRGTILRLTDLEGEACAQTLIYNADRTIERINIADTVKVQWNAYLGPGKLLLSDMGRALCSIQQDTCGNHDTFCGASTSWSNQRNYGKTDGAGWLPNARDRFVVALSKYGMGKRDIPGNVTFFKGIKIDGEGQLNFIEKSSKPGAFVELKAELNVLIVIANCPHVLDSRGDYTATKLRLTAWRGEPTKEGDALYHSTPEAERAFRNNDDYFLL